MKSRFLLAALALFGAAAAATPAAAQSVAYALPDGTTNMRAGPGFEYEVIAIIRGGSAVNVYGCLADFSWCDSSVENIRGWVSTTRLQFQYGGNLVPIPRYYSYFNAPIIGFDFGYWDRYYRDRPFYRDRERHRRDHNRHSRWRSESDGVGIFPEEGGGRHPRDQGPPPDFSDQGNDVIQMPDDQGGGRRRHRPPSDGNDVGVFPEEGGAPPRQPDSGYTVAPGSGDGAAGAPCPANNPSCR